MRLDTLVSFDGNSFSSNSMVGSLVEETPIAPATTPIWVSRSGAWPILAGKDFQGQVLNIEVTCQGSYNTQLETLIKWFATSDETPKQLIFQDTDNSSKQWFVYASAFQMSAQDGPTVVISLAVDDPVWQSVTLTSQTWNITASGDSTDFSIVGNQPSWPVLEVTPTSYPSDGWIYNRYILCYATSTDPWPSRPVDITGGGWDTAALVSSTDNFAQLNGALTSDTDVIPYDTVTGALPDQGWVYVDTEQIIYTSKTGTTSGNLLGVTRGAGGTTAATHLDNAVFRVSSVAADGRDVRVYQDGREIDYWIGTGANAFNQTATKIWCVLDMPPAYNLTLKTGIASTDTVTEIEANYTIANKNTLTAMPASGRVVISSEEFTYTAKTVTATKLALTVNSRSVRNTTAATHAANAAIRFVPYDLNIVYYNTTAAAPDIDDTKKPIIDLTSTNASFDYTVFSDNRRLRAGIWASGIEKEASARFSINKIYTGANDGGDTDPAAIAGMSIAAFQQGGTWKPETARLIWAARFTDTVASISESGEKFQTNVSWPATAGLQGSTDGLVWKAIKNESASATTDYGTWVSWTYASSDITVPANIGYLRYIFDGTVKATANNIAKFGATAITVGMTSVPTVSMRSQQTNYHFDGYITNSAGDRLTILYPLQINQTIYIDTNPDFPTAKFNGVIVNRLIKTNTIRPDWLHLKSGTETLTFTATRNGNVTVVVKHRARMLFL